jgi:hypothetical protein
VVRRGRRAVNCSLHNHGEQEGKEVSNHTEVNFWIVVDRHIDLFLCLCGPSVVSRRVVARDGLHGLFDQLVTLLFEALLVAVLASVDTAAKVVVLWGRRG